MPAILLLLVFGFLVGQVADPDVLLGRDLLFSAVSLAVAVILFEGGLGLRIKELKETGLVVFRLVTVGVLATWLLSTAAAYVLLEFDLSMAALIGAILVVSGPTVIVPLLRHIRPIRRVGSIVRWEGIVNDPIGALLAVLVFGVVRAGRFQDAALGAVGGLIATGLVAVVLAAAAAVLLVQMLKRFWVPDFLHSPVFLAVVVVVFTVSNQIWPESGLATVTILGILLANQEKVHVEHVVQFKENLRVVLISVLFIVLTSRLQWTDLTGLGFAGLGFLVVLLLVVRPIAAFLSMVRTETSWRERIFLAWLAPRGIVAAAVSSVFALELAEDHLSPAMAEQAEQLVAVAFLVIVGTVTVYGLTAGPLARWLKLADPNPQGILFASAEPFVQEIAAAVQNAGYEVLLIDTNHGNLSAARMRGLPTCWANVLSDYTREEVDLGGIGRLAAMTPNDVVNTLATQEFVELFGRAGVYQLAPRPAETGRQEPVAVDLLGRVLFGPGCRHADLAKRIAAGAVVKTTGLTDEFDYAAFCDLYGPSALVLFVIEPSGELRIVTDDNPPPPQPGQKLICLVDVVEETPATSG